MKSIRTIFADLSLLLKVILFLLVLYGAGLIYYFYVARDFHFTLIGLSYAIIVIAGLWKGSKSIGIAVFLAGAILLLRVIFSPSVILIEDFLHIIMFIVIAVVLSILKETERGAKASELTFRELFNNISKGTIIYEVKGDGDDFIVKDINKAGERISRLKKEDMIGKGILELLPGIKESGFFDAFKRVWQTGEPEYFPLVKHDDKDSIRLLDDYIGKMPNGEMFSSYDDVTEKKQAETALRESEEKFRKLFLNANDDIFLFELKEDKTPGQFIEVNNTACERLGYDRSELLKMTPNDITAPECQDLVRGFIEDYIKNRHGCFELNYISKRGCRIPTEIKSHLFVLNGKQVVMSIGWDISARKRVEETLQHYQLLFSTIWDMILISCSDGRIIEANEAAVDAYGYSRDELLGLNIKKLYVADFETKKNISSGKTYESIHCCKDGTSFPVEVSEAEATIGDELIVLNIIRNISERKENEIKIRDAQEIAHRSEKLALLGKMAAGIAHEINQPLNSLKVSADGMIYLYNKGKSFQTDEVLENLKKISLQAKRISNIITQMRAFVRNENFSELQNCNLNNVLEKGLDIVENQLLAHGITVKKTLSNNLPLIKGESTQLEQIVINLLINAIQALDMVDKNNKEITCTTRVEDEVILEISDNGPGVDKSIRRKIFEPFFTTKAVGEGMGLGLTVVHSKVNAFNGKIFVNENEQGGATFQVKFPALRFE